MITPAESDFQKFTNGVKSTIRRLLSAAPILRSNIIATQIKDICALTCPDQLSIDGVSVRWTRLPGSLVCAVIRRPIFEDYRHVSILVFWYHDTHREYILAVSPHDPLLLPHLYLAIQAKRTDTVAALINRIGRLHGIDVCYVEVR